MTRSNAASLQIGIAAAIALCILQIIWHAWLAPAKPALYWPALALAVLPLLPGLWTAMASLRRGVLICGIVCLFYFSHGIAELWNGVSPRILPLFEVLLCLTVVATLGWDARGYRRAKKTADASAASRIA